MTDSFQKRTFLCAAVLALATLGPTIARAEPTASERAMATQLFDDAEKAMARKDYATACPKYHESNRLDPQLGTLLHLGDCYEQAGKTASAWAAFKASIEIASARKDARERVAQERTAALEKVLSRLTISVAGEVAGLEVKLDDQVIGQPLWGSATPIDPGSHVVVVSAQGREDRRYDVAIAAGAQQTLSVEAGAAIETPEVAPPPDASPQPAPAVPSQSAPLAAPPQRDSGTGSPTLGYVALGVGIAGVVVGGVTGATVFGKKDTIESHCDANKTCDAEGLDAADSARTLSTVSTVSFVVGAVGVGAGMYFLLSGGGSEPRTAVSTQFRPGGGGFALVREF
ncbi:MAG: hypothetical protein R3B13_20900 [Polyangiaceae bacterium]